MNSTAVLALIGDLYAQIDALQEKLRETEKDLAEKWKMSKIPETHDPLGGPEEAAALARKESEA